MAAMAVGTGVAARVSSLGTSSVASSSSLLRWGGSSLVSGQKIVVGLVSLPCVQRVARLTVQARRGEVEPVALEQSIGEAWTSLISGNHGVARNAAIVAAMNVLLTMPALAEEKGKIFDFNLTLPIIAIEFLLLMVALDNIWFKPVAAVMDNRDVEIREKLMGVRDNSGEIQKLQDEAEAIIKAARADTTAALNNMKRETAAALETNLQESKARIEEELAASLANLEEQKEETMRGLDKQVQALSDEIISKVIPFKV